MTTMPIAKLRRKILRDKGVRPLKHTNIMLPPHEHPDTFPKTDMMKMIEYKYKVKLEDFIFTGSLSEVARRLNGDVDRTTISKWRKYIKEITVR